MTSADAGQGGELDHAPMVTDLLCNPGGRGSITGGVGFLTRISGTGLRLKMRYYRLGHTIAVTAATTSSTGSFYDNVQDIFQLSIGFQCYGGSIKNYARISAGRSSCIGLEMTLKKKTAG